MTVRELIAELSKHDPDMIVVTYSPLDHAFVELEGERMTVKCKKMIDLYHLAYDDQDSQKVLVI
jgi:hypothetical protein